MVDKVKCYSDTVSEDIRSLVLRIHARHGTSFRTRAFSPDGEETKRLWREARLSQKDNLWRVTQCQRASNMTMDEDGQIRGGFATRRQTILTSACFFDALYACALFEVSEAQGHLNKEAVGLAIKELGDNHYKAFALNEGILINQEDNLPIPVADGEVLADTFVVSEQDELVSRKSQGNLLSHPVKPLGADNIIGSTSTLVEGASQGSSTDLVLRAASSELAFTETKAGIESVSKARLKKLKTLANSFDTVVKYQGKSLVYKLSGDPFSAISSCGLKGGVSMLLAGMAFPIMPELFVGLGGVLSIVSSAVLTTSVMLEEDFKLTDIWTKNGLVMPNRHFKNKVRYIRKFFSESTDETLKAEGARYADCMELSQQTLQARYAFNCVAKNKGMFNQMRLKTQLVKLEDLARSKNMPEGDIGALLNSICKDAGSELLENDILLKMKKETDHLRAICENLKTDQIKRLPAPAV